jgi:hypothetical protein
MLAERCGHLVARANVHADPSRHIVAIACVFTPRAFRNRGYVGAATAAVADSIFVARRWLASMPICAIPPQTAVTPRADSSRSVVPGIVQQPESPVWPSGTKLARIRRPTIRPATSHR